MQGPLLVFDLDGTLIDTAPDLLATLDVVLATHGFAPRPDAGLRDGIGHGARHLIETALHRQGVAPAKRQLDAMHAAFLAHYEANICRASLPYPELVAMLDRLAAGGWRFAVCTNKPEGLSRRLLAALGLADRFAAICGADTFSVRKPHPAHLLQTIAQADGRRDRAIMVGDSRTDIDTARAAAVPVVGVTFGYTPVPMADLEPDLVIDDFAALTEATLEALLHRGGGAADVLTAPPAIPISQPPSARSGA